MGLIFDRNELHTERLERFQHHLRRNVAGRRIRWNVPADKCGAMCLAGHMRAFVEMKEGRELNFHNDPAEYFGIHAKLWYNLVMAKGHSYVVHTKVLDLTSAVDRHKVAMGIIEHLLLQGGVAWYNVCKEVYGREQVDHIIKWDYDRMGG